MKKCLLLSLAALFAMTAGVTSAQAQKGEFKNPKREFRHGFVSVSGGTLVYVGDYTSEREIGDRMAPIMDVSLGMMFNPYLGTRLEWSGWNAFGVAQKGDKFQGGHLRDTEDLYKNDFYFNYAHVDLLWNLSNTIGGPKEDRFWDFVPYVGVGWVNAAKDGARPSNRLGVNVGLMQQFRLSPSVDILLDVRGMGTNHNTDGVVKVDGDKFDLGLSASLGLAYNFGRQRTNVVAIPVDLTPYENRINSLERDLTDAEARAKRLADELNAERAKEKTVIYNVTADLAIWFPIGKSSLTEQEKINLGYIAEAIKKAPSDKVYTIFGSADKQTGNAALNKKLSEQRAKIVHDELVRNGVSASQLRMNAVGDTQAKFDKPLLNRVAIVQGM